MGFPDYNNLDPVLKDYLDLLDSALGQANEGCILDYRAVAWCQNKKTGNKTKTRYSSNVVLSVPGNIIRCPDNYEETAGSPCPCSEQNPCGWKHDPGLLNFILSDLLNAGNQAKSNLGKCKECESTHMGVQSRTRCGGNSDRPPYPGQQLPNPGSPPKPPTLVPPGPPPGEPFDPGNFPDAINPSLPKNQNSKVSYSNGKNGKTIS